MYQRAIDRQTWADIRDELTTFEQSKPGIWWVSVGAHPDLGCITVVEDEQDQVILLSQNPIQARGLDVTPSYTLGAAFQSQESNSAP